MRACIQVHTYVGAKVDAGCLPLSLLLPFEIVCLMEPGARRLDSAGAG